MKAALLQQFGAPLLITEVPDPVPGRDDVVMRVMACGIDGTDLKLLDGFGYTPTLPFVMGHEPAGVVEEVGANVSTFAPGDRVIPYIFLIPPTSNWLQSPRSQLCPEMTGVVGVKNAWGGYAEKLCVPARQLCRIPDGIAWHDAAVLCDAGLTAWHAVDRLRLLQALRGVEAVLVIGVGGVGSFAVQFIKANGNQVIAVEQGPEKVAWANSLDCDVVIDATTQDVATEARRLTEGRGVACVLDIVGSSASLNAGIEALGYTGDLVLVGYAPEECRIATKLVAQKELRIVGSRGGSFGDLKSVVDRMATGQVKSIVTQRRPLEAVNEALAELKSGRILGRLVLEPGR